MPTLRRFKQVDVFSRQAFSGNPLAVILDAEGLSDSQMQAIARWTNLSETTFVLPADDTAADYRVRIFSPQTEFPFAGHPTLGTAHALLEAGLRPRTPGQLIQQCGIGLVTVRIGQAGRLAFRAPEVRLEPLAPAHGALLDAAVAGAACDPRWPALQADVGIRWLLAHLPAARDCLAVRPDPAALAVLLAACGVDGLALHAPHPDGAPADYEVRALLVERGALVEDPVTGSANACIARVLQATHSAGYSVRQGTALARDGRVHVSFDSDAAWIGGDVLTVIDGRLQA